ncbi:hypothetical protein BH24GEM2_BH24GEM2_05420 [soil metagenome]
MLAAFFLLVTVLLTACTPSASHVRPASGAAASASTEQASRLVGLHQRFQVPAISTREFTHAQLWGALGPVVDRAANMQRDTVGRSAEGRPLYLVRYGQGPVRVLLWSQMHGNESTATLALADLLRFLAESPGDPLARRLAEKLTILAVPMLNPDGAERFQRRNALGIDINRDARALVTPEGRALKTLQERFRPAWGFNLHDQDVRSRVGGSDRLAAFALLAPPFNPSRDDNAVRLRAKQLASVIRLAAEPLVGGHITRYDDTFNPRAFGDLMQSWGVSTVLIESGGWRDDPEKQYLRRVNFVALLTALDAIATGAYAGADLAWYEGLPPNGRQVNDLLVRGATMVSPGMAPYRADVAIDYRDSLGRRGGRVVDIGDLREYPARDTLDASGLFLHSGPDGPLMVDVSTSFVLRRGAAPGSAAVWTLDNGVPRPVPAGRAR